MIRPKAAVGLDHFSSRATRPRIATTSPSGHWQSNCTPQPAINRNPFTRDI